MTAHPLALGDSVQWGQRPGVYLVVEVECGLMRVVARATVGARPYWVEPTDLRWLDEAEAVARLKARDAETGR